MTGKRRILGVAAIVAVLAVDCGPKTPPISELSTEDLWNGGVAAFNAKAWSEAIRYFDRFSLTGGTYPCTYHARLHVARAHFERKEYVTSAESEAARTASGGSRVQGWVQPVPWLRSGCPATTTSPRSIPRTI